MDIHEALRLKLQQLIYPSGATANDETNSIYLGTTRLRDVPEHEDDFFRLWFLRFNNLTKWFWFLRDLIEQWWVKHRFISFAEYQEVYKDKMVKDGKDIQIRYPVYRLLDIANEKQRQRFVNTYPNKITGYFGLMHKVNLPLWEMYNKRHTVRLPKKEMEKHTYILGGTGSGKSELLKHLVLQDVGKAEKCVIVIEPNGDLSEQIASQHGIPPERLIYINCGLDLRTPSINPFELMDTNNDLEVEKQSQIIRIALQQIFQGDGQPLTLQMQSIIEPCLEIVAKQKGTLKDLQRFMVNGINEDLLAAGKASPKHRDFFERKFNDGNLTPSRQGIYQKLMNLLNMTTFSDFFCGKTTIRLQQAIAEKKVIVFNLSKGKIGDISSVYIGKMLIAIIQNLIFQRESMKEEKRTPIAIYVDEFQDFINESAESMFVQGRKYKVNLTVASQVIGQKMTTEMTKIVLGNTNVKFVGMNGYETLRVMSKETYTEIEELKDLTVGQFFCRIGNGQGFILKVPEKHLGWTTCKDEAGWLQVQKNQIERYYKARALHSPTTPAPPPKNQKQQEPKQPPKPDKQRDNQKAQEPKQPPKPDNQEGQTPKNTQSPQQERKEEPESQRPKQKRFTPKYK
jgi:hypothetical protein